MQEALLAGKHVFVEKPLAMTLESLAAIESTYQLATLSGKPLQLMVGFNRRFAPHIQTMKRLLDVIKVPKSFIITVNAGRIPAQHWVHDTMVGWGRIIGEACHFIDLLRYLIGEKIVSIQAQSLLDANNEQATKDTTTIGLGFADGSLGTIHYFANGASVLLKS